MEPDKYSNENQAFVDILKERRSESDILWASRHWIATSAYKVVDRFSPEKIKSLVLHSYRINKIIKKVHNDKQVPLNELYDMVKNILNEIGYDRQESILRWLGFFVAKVLKKLLLAVYVNEVRFLKIKSEMGKNPLIFVPSHKSYCDFILMSYICFHYEVDIPRIAAGMDFQSMALMGNVLRDACAFFMRRTFNDDELYSAVFSQYVHTLIVYGDAAIEFFIEGTRSRTQKALMPKYGFLSMALKPFLTGLIPDITIVPVNLSYDRVLEENLFAYELLGVPKPKETTKGLFKALSILNEKYGNVYVRFGDPFSVKHYFNKKIDRSIHDFDSVEMQDLTPNESVCLANLAHFIVQKQKKLTSITCFNLIAAVLNNHLLTHSEPPYLDGLISEIQWFFEIFRVLVPENSSLTVQSITENVVLHHFNLHKSLIYVSSDKKVQLSRIHSANAKVNLLQLKGHELSSCTMDIAIPVLMLQFYANPCATFLIGVCFIALIVQSLSEVNLITIDELLKDFEFLCSIFSFEFVLHRDFFHEDFAEAFNHSKYFRILKSTKENAIEKGDNNNLISFSVNFLSSYIPGYMTVMKLLLGSVGAVYSEKQILKECQQKLELKLKNGTGIHPANLSLDLLKNALQAMISMKAVSKEKGRNGFEYRANREDLEKIHSKLKEQLLLNHGWEHFWCNPKNLFIREFIKGPFLKPQLLNSIPYVTNHQKDGSSIRLKEGIPDCWAEYLAHNLIFRRGYLRNYDLMHKEDVEIVPQLRKNYRLYIGQGIPDPWTSYPYVCNPEIITRVNPKDVKKHLLHFSRPKKESCYCCQKKYLFECPDKSRINTCRCRDCHKKSTPLTTDCGENCKCVSALRDWVSKNAYLKQRKSQCRKPSPESGLSSNDSKTEDEGPHPRAESYMFCECPGRKDSSDIPSSETGEEENEKSHNSNSRNKTFSKNQSRICCCPYMKNAYIKRSPNERNFPEPIITMSKQIQTEHEKDSKTVQTDNSKSKVQFRCQCNSACPNCGVFQCKKSWAKVAFAAPQTLTNMCFTPGVIQNPAILCPYSFPNNVIIQKPSRRDEVKKGNNKLEKNRPTEEACNIELRGKKRESRAHDENVLRKSESKVLSRDTKNDDFSNDKSINYSRSGPKGFDLLKYLTEEKIKCLEQEERRPGSKFVNFCKGNPSASTLNPERFKLDRFKAFSGYKPRFSEFSGDNKAVYWEKENRRAPNSSDQATMTMSEETRKSQKEEVRTKSKYFKEVGESDVECRTFCSFGNCQDSNKAYRRRRRLLTNRKRRRKLAASGKSTILEYQSLMNKLAKRPELVNKQVQVEGTEQHCHSSKKMSFTENNPSISGISNFYENTSLKHLDAALDSNPLIARAMKRTEQETAKDSPNCHLGEYSKIRIPGESLRQSLRSDMIFGKALEKISFNNSTWTSKALKNIIDDILVEKKSQEI